MIIPFSTVISINNLNIGTEVLEIYLTISPSFASSNSALRIPHSHVVVICYHVLKSVDQKKPVLGPILYVRGLCLITTSPYFVSVSAPRGLPRADDETIFVENYEKFQNC